MTTKTAKTESKPKPIKLKNGVIINPLPWDGTEETRPKEIPPGLYLCDGKTFSRCPGTSKTAVKDVLPPSTPAHFIDKRRNPGRYPPTTAMILGRYIHAIMFEPELGNKFFVTPDGFARRSNEQKAQFDKWVKQYGWEYVLHEKGQKDAYNLAKEIVANIRSREYTAKALSGGYPEVAIFWRDEVTGRTCKTKADYIKPLADGGFLVGEFKTVDDLDPESMMRAVSYRALDVDIAFTADGVRAATGKPAYPLIIAALKKPPYLAQEYELPPPVLERAQAHYRTGLETLTWCYENDIWMGYSDRPIVIDRLLPYIKRLGGADE